MLILIFFIMNKNFLELFPNPMPLIGKVRLTDEHSLKKALDDIVILSGEGFDSAIIEVHYQFHPKYLKSGKKEENPKLLKNALEQLTSETNMPLGLNILAYEIPGREDSPDGASEDGETMNPLISYQLAFPLADTFLDVGIEYIQLDYLAGEYLKMPKLDLANFDEWRKQYSQVKSFVGVWPGGYLHPSRKSIDSFTQCLKESAERSDAFIMNVMTPDGTQSYDLAKHAKHICPGKPLIYGYGVDAGNFSEAARIADGIIINSYLRDDNDELILPNLKIIKSLAEKARKEKE